MKLHQYFQLAALTAISVFSLSARALDFPLRAEDITNVNSRYNTFDHAAGGSQSLAKDIGAMRYLGNNKWSSLRTDGASDTVNANYMVYGAKIRAMSAGTVVGCWRNSPENAAKSKLQKLLDGYIPIAGNHVWIQQDDGVRVLYAHAQPGTVPSSLCPHNATYLSTPSGSAWSPGAAVTGGVRVTPGQLLGIVGNSGNSTGPHLHVHMEKNGAAVAMKFAHGQTTPLSGNTASIGGPWKQVAGGTLPSGSILVWAPHSVGYWTINNINDEHYQGWFNHMVDSGEMIDTLPCSSNGQKYNSTWVPSKGSWISHHGMSLSDFTSKSDAYANAGYTRTGWWYCGPVYTGIWRK